MTGETQHKSTVLVVNDDIAQLYALSHMLAARGCEVLTATTGAAALQKAHSSLAAIVLDKHLPDLHGFEVCKRLKSNPETKNIPIIFVSSTAHAVESRAQATVLGATAFLSSPVDADMLVEAWKKAS